MKIRHSEGLHKAHFICLRIYFGLFSSIHLFYSVKQMKTVTHTGDCKRLWTGANSRLSATPESYSPGCCSLGATSRPQPRPTDPESSVQEAPFFNKFPGDLHSLELDPGIGCTASCHQGGDSEDLCYLIKPSPRRACTYVHTDARWQDTVWEKLHFTLRFLAPSLPGSAHLRFQVTETLPNRTYKTLTFPLKLQCIFYYIYV